MLLAFVLAGPGLADWNPFSYRPLPNSLDMMEAGLYWLQDMSRPTEAGDPATLLGAAQELAARQFDFAEMAWYTAGFDYLRKDILARSHYQHRLQDRLFAELARSLGMYDSLPPDMRVLPPLSTGVGRGLISVLMLRRHRPPQRLDFHLRYGAQGWRIVDVGNNGLLFSAYLRQQGFR